MHKASCWFIVLQTVKNISTSSTNLISNFKINGIARCIFQTRLGLYCKKIISLFRFAYLIQLHVADFTASPEGQQFTTLQGSLISISCQPDLVSHTDILIMWEMVGISEGNNYHPRLEHLCISAADNPNVLKDVKSEKSIMFACFIILHLERINVSVTWNFHKCTQFP